jgi:hypothetical protein
MVSRSVPKLSDSVEVRVTDMANYKKNSTAPDAARETNGNPANPTYESTLRHGRARNLVGQDMGAWDSYRRWLSRVQTADKRRATMDPALYTWKGYRSWSEKVRRDWKQED